MNKGVLVEARETPADPKLMRGIDVTGRQAPKVARRRAPRAVRPDAVRAMEIAAWARATFPPNPTVVACRIQAGFSSERAAAKRHGGPAARPTPVRRRWGAFLLARGAVRLTPAQARSLRRRSTLPELFSLSPAERRMIGLEF